VTSEVPLGAKNPLGTFKCTLDKYCTHLMSDLGQACLKCNNSYTSYSELLDSCYGAIGTVFLITTRLPSGASVGTNASSTALLPAVWEYSYTVPVNSSIGLSQTILQWNQGGLRCCMNF
jgi:hypothetical protein